MGLVKADNVTPVYRGTVSGLSYYGYGQYVNKLRVGTILALRSVENQYDSQAVGVFYDGDQIGWIPKAYNTEVSERVRRGEGLFAVVTNHDLTAKFDSRLYINVFTSRSDQGRTAADPPVTKPTVPQAPNTTSLKEHTMNKIEQVINTNKKAVTSAAFLEAGYIANKQMSKGLAKKLPVMVRGYADTPVGRLLVANLAVLLVQHFRPENQQLVRLASAMQTQAYGELIRDLDIDGMIDELLENGSIKRALTKLDGVTED